MLYSQGMKIFFAAAVAFLLSLPAGPAAAKVLKIYPGQMEPFPGGGHSGSIDSYVTAFGYARSYGANPAIWTYHLKLGPGSRISKLVLHQKGNAGPGIRTQMTLFRVRLGEEPETVASVSSDDATNVIVQAEVPLSPSHVVARDYAYYLEFWSKDGNAWVYGGEVHYRPPSR